MRRLWNWMKTWWGLGRVARKLSALDKRLKDLENDRQNLEVIRKAHYLSWEMLKKEMEDAVEKAAEDLQKADALIVRYEEELEAARSQIAIHEESIDTLVSANRTFKEAWDALSAEQIRRRVVSSPMREVIE
jgi:chromosome segregation ATPase